MAEAKTRSELLKEVKSQGLTVESKEYAKKHSKSSNSLTVDDLQSILSAGKAEVLTKEEQINETIILNNTQVMAIVTDHYTGARTDESLVGEVYECSWGNKGGSAQAAVTLDGSPQYLHYGTIRLLKTIKLTSLRKNAKGEEDPKLGDNRFTVIIVDGWSEKELEAYRQEHKV